MSVTPIIFGFDGNNTKQEFRNVEKWNEKSGFVSTHVFSVWITKKHHGRRITFFLNQTILLTFHLHNFQTQNGQNKNIEKLFRVETELNDY